MIGGKHILRHDCVEKSNRKKDGRKKTKSRQMKMLLDELMTKNGNLRYGQLTEMVQCRADWRRWITELAQGQNT